MCVVRFREWHGFFRRMMRSGPKEAGMSAKMLALTSLLLASAFAQTEWQEFASRDGNFRVLFPDYPQEQTLTERNLHQFTAAVGTESYGVAYADYPAGTAWENVVDAARDSIVKDLGGSVVDEKRTFVEGYPGKFVRFVGQNTRGELTIYFVAQR